MKLKYYLRGCGVGIVLTVVIFMVALKAKGGIMTDQKVMQRASELGMVMKEEIQKDLDTQTASETQTNADTQGALRAVTDTQETVQNTQQDNSGKSTQAEEHKKLQEKKEEKDSQKEIVISVKKGDVCRDVAERLYEKGLVKDAEEFRVYMGEHGYAKNLCIGQFSLKKGMSYEQIAKTLTKK